MGKKTQTQPQHVGFEPDIPRPVVQRSTTTPHRPHDDWEKVNEIQAANLSLSGNLKRWYDYNMIYRYEQVLKDGTSSLQTTAATVPRVLYMMLSIIRMIC